jgi:transglutaminase-like putative cysteine protease
MSQIKYALLAISLSVVVTIPYANLKCQTARDDEATGMERRGNFKDATALLKKEIADDSVRLPAAERRKILYQIERMRRIRIDYSLTANQLYAQLVASVRGITREEFDSWIKEGRFDAREIDDTLRFVSTSRSNLFFRFAELAGRRIDPPANAEQDRAIFADCVSVERAADSLKAPYVSPMRFEMKMELSVDSGAVSPGETVRAWLPIPRSLPYQNGFRLISSSSRPIDIAAAESPIRSLYMEQPASPDGGALFTMRYTYKTMAVHFHLDSNLVEAYRHSDPIYRQFTREGPNIIFTGKIRKLSKEIVGSETNPLLKARRIYDWISRNIKYSFAREYSTIDNISDYCLTKEYGDCGQEALLFITLCRFNGVPARWQSGWFLFPGGKDIHDWMQIYVRPYGWIPVDPYMGILAMHYMTDLSDGERDTVRNFYFGGLDNYRMAANSDNNQILTPAKKYFRSDNVDFQRGELETRSRNIYFDRFKYQLEIEKVTTE